MAIDDMKPAAGRHLPVSDRSDTRTFPRELTDELKRFTGCGLKPSIDPILVDSSNQETAFATCHGYDKVLSGRMMIYACEHPHYLTLQDGLDYIKTFPDETTVMMTITPTGDKISIRLYSKRADVNFIFSEHDDKWIVSDLSCTDEYDHLKFLNSKVLRKTTGTYVNWFYKDSKGEIHQKPMKLTGALPQPEFYPSIPDLEQFYKDFSDSTANVLLLIGPPGTGKTTFLRGLLTHMNLTAWITYDASIQQDESFSIRFADPDDDEGRVLVLEDCDTLMESRTDGNQVMNRILNLADGLVTLPKRKLIFSTNLPSLKDVDEALLRPGRCFGAIQFRKLQPWEADAAAKSIGLEKYHDKPVNLAQALNDNNNVDAAIRKVGF